MRGERRKQDYERLQDFPFAALVLVQFIHGYHEGTHGSIERERLYVGLHLQDQSVQGLQFFGRRSVIGHDKAVPSVKHPPHSLKEPGHSVYSLGIPWLGLLQRAEEHLVQSQCVRSVGIAHHIRIDYIVHGLAHLLYSVSADILTVLKDEFGISELRSPLAECLDVKPVIMHDIDIDMYLCRFVSVFQAV